MTSKKIFILLLLAISGAGNLVAQSEVKLTASDGREVSGFGLNVFSIGDYALVGATLDDENGAEAGAVYVYRRDGLRWLEEAKLMASDGEPQDYFGVSVSMSGDYILIGAEGNDDKGSRSGAAYVFKRDGMVWSEDAKLTAPDGEAFDAFGLSVSISGDYALVGSMLDDDKGSGSGAAYMFKREGGFWLLQDKLLASDGVRDDGFGISVSLDGDYALIGAWKEDEKGFESGSAYIFKRDGTDWKEQTKLIATDGRPGDRFGIEVSLHGEHALVGAIEEDTNGGNSGAAYVFRRDGTMWDQEAKLIPSDNEGNDLFGGSVSLHGEYALVSSRLDDDRGDNSGSAYLFKQEGTTWIEQVKLTASDAAEGDLFGFSVSLSGDYVLVGASRNDSREVDAGAAYIYALQEVSSVSNKEEPIPDDLTLHQNYPNPFSVTSTITYTLRHEQHNRLDIYDLLGQHVSSLVDRPQPPGTYTVPVDASSLPGGVYLYRLQAGGFSATKVLTVLK